jgi:predicted nucleotide-binding protein
MAKSKASTPEPEKERASRVNQADVPRYGLDEALRIASAIIDNYAGAPTPPLRVAKAINASPTSSGFRMLCGSSIAYGLTTGGYNASEIVVELLARQILRPLTEDQDLKAKRQAFLRPRVIGEFLRKYHNSPLPREEIAKNVLADLSVPEDRVDEVLLLIIKGATELGLLSTIKDKRCVDLTSDAAVDAATAETDVVARTEPVVREVTLPSTAIEPPLAAVVTTQSVTVDSIRRKKVFVTHGKNQALVEPIKKLLQFGELEAVVSVEKQSVSQPVPDKVMNDMRACGAAIIHVDAEQQLIDKEAHEHIVLNPNVLIEIGAAMALYGRRFILLVRDGVKLPSNLQGLFEVRYSGETLDGTATIRLLEAINDMKKAPLLT